MGTAFAILAMFWEGPVKKPPCILVLDISYQQLGEICQLEGFCRECTFCNKYIYWKYAAAAIHLAQCHVFVFVSYMLYVFVLYLRLYFYRFSRCLARAVVSDWSAAAAIRLAQCHGTG